MRDFTLETYRQYVMAIQSSYSHIIRFDEYFEAWPRPEVFCMIRHDVDRKPKNALNMARLEYELGIRSTYYFRTTPQVFKPDMIRQVADWGHEIGYHYECLSDTNGDMEQALDLFGANLDALRQIADVKTISMHGRPLKKYDNRDLWKDQANKERLRSQFGILGEVYLDIDYEKIAYINDTGRNWQQQKNNKRDIVSSSIHLALQSHQDLLNYLHAGQEPRLIFLTHPERWEPHLSGWMVQWATDQAINVAKRLL